jgi:hypothetical protein
MLSPGDESPFGENRGGTPAGERARKRRAAQAAFPWCAPHAACVRASNPCVCRRSASFFLFLFRSPDERSDIRVMIRPVMLVPHIASLMRATRCKWSCRARFVVLFGLAKLGREKTRRENEVAFASPQWGEAARVARG